MEQILSQLQEGVITILGLLISLGVVYATIFINRQIAIAKSKGAMIEDEKQRQLYLNSLDDMHKVLLSSIVRVDAQLKPELLEAIRDGKIDKSELSTLSNVVVKDVLENLKQDSINAIAENVGDVNLYIQGELEKKLAELKRENIIPKLDGVTMGEYLEAQKQIEELKKQLELKEN